MLQKLKLKLYVSDQAKLGVNLHFSNDGSYIVNRSRKANNKLKIKEQTSYVYLEY